MFFLSSAFWEVENTGNKGNGVFAKKEIPAGTIIGDYLGKVIAAEDSDSYDTAENFYSMYLSENASIFPDLSAAGIHLINHSCAPTCWIYIFKGHALYFALRKIFPGEELTVDYLLDPIDNSCAPCNDICHCGEPFCRNIMHAGKKLSEAWESFSEPARKQAKYSIGRQLPKLSAYPKSIPDNVLYTLFGSKQNEGLVLNRSTFPSSKEVRKIIREEGKKIILFKMNIEIYGVINNMIITKPSITGFSS